MKHSEITNLMDLKIEKQRVQALIVNKEVDLEQQLLNATSGKNIKNEVFGSIAQTAPVWGDLLKAAISTKLVKSIGKVFLKKVYKYIK